MQAHRRVICATIFRVGLRRECVYTNTVPDAPPTFPESPPRAWAEVDLASLRHNFSIVRDRRQGEVMAVLKAGAYGHGIEEIAKALENLPSEPPPAFMGVASVIEARRLANTGVSTRIYLLGPTCPFEREEIVARGWTPCVSSVDEAADFNRIARSAGNRLQVHITVDTGMGRGGFLPDDLPGKMPMLDNLDALELEGIGSHLPSADEDAEFTRAQFEQFDALVGSLGVERFRYRHLANSAGLLGYESRTTNLCRPGLMLYGISPLPPHQADLRPVMTLKSRVSLVRNLPAGQGISYGRETVLEKQTRVATVGIGYGDGYPRGVSMRDAEVWIRGNRCPLLGRVTMDQLIVDVSCLDHCESGDEVELFGKNILVSEVAQKAGTIPWAVLTGITPRVTRIHLP